MKQKPVGEPIAACVLVASGMNFCARAELAEDTASTPAVEPVNDALMTRSTPLV